MTRDVNEKHYRDLLPAARKHLKANPPPANILAAVQAMLDPGPAPKPKDQHHLHHPYIVWRELRWLQNPLSEKRGGPHTRGAFTPTNILVSMVALWAVFEEGGNPLPAGDGTPRTDCEGIQLAVAVIRMRKRPKLSHRHVKYKNSPKLYSDQSRIPGSVRRALAERIRRPPLSTYLFLTARAVLAAYEADRVARGHVRRTRKSAKELRFAKFIDGIEDYMKPAERPTPPSTPPPAVVEGEWWIGLSASERQAELQRRATRSA